MEAGTSSFSVFRDLSKAEIPKHQMGKSGLKVPDRVCDGMLSDRRTAYGQGGTSGFLLRL